MVTLNRRSENRAHYECHRQVFRPGFFAVTAILFTFVHIPLHANTPLENRVARSWPVMGTYAEVVLNIPEQTENSRAAIQHVRDAFERVNRTMSVYEKSSDLMRINRNSGRRAITVDPWLADLIAKGRRAALITKRAFSMNVLWYGIQSNLKPDLVSVKKSSISDRFIEVNQARNTVFLRRDGMGLDLGGIAKGYALDRAEKILREYGFDRYLITLGRNIMAGASPKSLSGWPVQIREEQTVRFLNDIALSVSEQGIRSDTGHILNPRTGGSVKTRGWVAVAARNGWVADMASTAILVDHTVQRRLFSRYKSIEWILNGRP